MGLASDPVAVVDGDNRVYDVEALRVVRSGGLRGIHCPLFTINQLAYRAGAVHSRPSLTDSGNAGR